MRIFSPTGRTAEPTSIRTLVGYHEQERTIAVDAESFFCAQPPAISENERLVIAHKLGHAARAVAPMAAGYKIVTLVVRDIVVEMIDNQRAVTSAFPRHPIHFDAAPVASMRSPTDRLEQDEALYGHLAVRCREWMTGTVNAAIAVHRRTVYSQ